MNEIKLKIYDNEFKNVEREVTAQKCVISFGTVRKFVKIFKVDDMKNGTEIFETIVDAFDEVTCVLSRIFPDVKEDEWNRVDVNELVPLVIDIAKFIFRGMFKIPTQKN